MTKKLEELGSAVPIVLMMVDGLAITTPSWLNALPPCAGSIHHSRRPSPCRKFATCMGLQKPFCGA